MWGGWHGRGLSAHFLSAFHRCEQPPLLHVREKYSPGELDVVLLVYLCVTPCNCCHLKTFSFCKSVVYLFTSFLLPQRKKLKSVPWNPIWGCDLHTVLIVDVCFLPKVEERGDNCIHCSPPLCKLFSLLYQSRINKNVSSNFIVITCPSRTFKTQNLFDWTSEGTLQMSWNQKQAIKTVVGWRENQDKNRDSQEGGK